MKGNLKNTLLTSMTLSMPDQPPPQRMFCLLSYSLKSPPNSATTKTPPPQLAQFQESPEPPGSASQLRHRPLQGPQGPPCLPGRSSQFHLGTACSMSRFRICGWRTGCPLQGLPHTEKNSGELGGGGELHYFNPPFLQLLGVGSAESAGPGDRAALCTTGPPQPMPEPISSPFRAVRGTPILRTQSQPVSFATA